MEFDLQTVAVNAIGYLIGLSTNPTNMMSVMSNLFNYGDTSRRNLVQDDQDAVAFLYPKATNPCPAPPAPGSATACLPTPPVAYCSTR